MARPSFDPRTARSRGYVEPLVPPGPLMRIVLAVWFLIRFVVAAAMTAAFAGLALLLWFGFTMPGDPEEPGTKTDTIVVLTGGEERLEQAFGLLKGGMAGKLFISGIGKATKADILKRLGDPPADLASRIELEYRSGDTRQNARETAAWFNQQNFTSMRLVTSNYHMRRSLLLFRRAMPQARILVHPVVLRQLSAREWWTHRTGIETVSLEMAKFIATVFRVPIG